MTNFNRYNYQVAAHDVDLTHHCSPLAIIDYILDSAGSDAHALNFGITELLARGVSWVLSRLTITFEGQLSQGECFSIDTWIESISRLSSVRNFELLDSQNHPIAYASTQWAMIDIQRREAVDLSSIAAYNAHIKPIKGHVSPPARVRGIDAEVVESRPVRYSDIDINLHTNTFCYLRWMLDNLPLEILKEQQLARIDLNFIKESRLGDTLQLKAQQSDDNIYTFEILNQRDEVICRAQMHRQVVE